MRHEVIAGVEAVQRQAPELVVAVAFKFVRTTHGNFRFWISRANKPGMPIDDEPRRCSRQRSGLPVCDQHPSLACEIENQKSKIKNWPSRSATCAQTHRPLTFPRSEEHTSELQSQSNLVCRLLLEKKNK